MNVSRASRLLAVLLAVSAAISCGLEKTTAPAAPQADLIGSTLSATGQLVGSLLTCSPLPADADSARIGPNGGTLQMGPHSLVIPRGALTSTIWIKGEVVSDDVNSIRFSPEGLRFAKPAALVMSYRNCSLTGGLLTPKRIAYTRENLNIIEWVPSVDNILNRTVTGRLDHFSRYAVGW